MDLAEYIEKSLVAISKGVKEAQEKAHVTIAPGFVEGKPLLEAQMVKLEVEVATTSEGGGKINVLSFGSGEASRASQRAHKITFEVPVFFNSINVYSGSEFK
ncbi:MAG: trypco2 family protein [Pseudomonadota bacterium]